MHLKVIQQMSKVPRVVGIPSLSDSAFDEAVPANTVGGRGRGDDDDDDDGSGSGPRRHEQPGAPDDDGRMIHPLAAMGLTEEQYVMLQNLVAGESSFPGVAGMDGNGGGRGEKRALDESGDARDGKRGRFERVE
jgi:osomolarity two-component system response regulator SKN7